MSVAERELNLAAVEVQRNSSVRVGKAQAQSFGDLVGESESMRHVFALLSRASETDATVLIEGETGTGKDRAAFAIHRASDHRSGPFIVVDCGAIAETLIESELFGHEKGSFTGAIERHIGAFEQAHGGTVFLDEIGELPLDLQPKLLRVLEERTVRRIGSGDRMDLDVRIIAATHRDLRRAVAEGKFRSDLYFRLSVLKISMPPLRARTEDLAMLARTLLVRSGARPDQLQRFTTPSFIAQLENAPWPGNVRELRNYLERCVVLDSEQPISDPLLSEDSGTFSAIDGAMRYAEARKRAILGFERVYLLKLLERTHGNVSRAAREAGIDRVYLHRLIRRHKVKG